MNFIIGIQILWSVQLLEYGDDGMGAVMQNNEC